MSRSEIEYQANSYTFKYPLERVRNYSQQIDTLSVKINNLTEKKLLSNNSKILSLSKPLKDMIFKRV